MIIILRKLDKEKNPNDAWSVEEMKKEQLYFLVKGDNNASKIVHSDTNEPYYAFELAKDIYSKELEELEKFKKNQKGKKRKLKIPDIIKIKKLKKENLSNRKIAKILGVSEGTIRNYLIYYPIGNTPKEE